MRRFLLVLPALVLLAARAAPSTEVAQTGDCSVAVTPRAENGNPFYEISPRGFPAGQPLRIEALNTRINQGALFLTDVSGAFLGKDPDGFFYRVSPGIWNVTVRGGGCKAKTSFGVSGVPIGTWGGTGVDLVTSDSGAKLFLFCVEGSTDQPLAPDVNGNFDVSSTTTRDGPGPIGDVKPVAVRYTGWTDGKSMTLTVTPIDGSSPAMTFSLTFGTVTRIPACV